MPKEKKNNAWLPKPIVALTHTKSVCTIEIITIKEAWHLFCSSFGKQDRYQNGPFE